MAEDVIEEYTELVISKAALSYTPAEPVGVVGGVVKDETELLLKVNEILQKVSDEKLYFDWLDAANKQAAKVSRPIP